MLQSSVQHTAIDAWIQAYLEDNRPRARSLIVTLFGDTVMPYCERIWVGDLIALLAPFGVNGRLVRTSVYRLSEAGWLSSQRNGRRSYYTLAPAGRRRFQHAYARVYHQPGAWQGGWAIAVLPKNTDAVDRAQLRRELEWEGFAAAGRGVFLRPTDDASAAREVINSLNLNPIVSVFEAHAADAAAPPAITDLVAQSWSLEPAAEAYASFNAKLSVLLPHIQAGTELAPAQAFMIQTLMIDAFRWATLRDPQLPAALLPESWPGHSARALCGKLYRQLHDATRRHLAAILDTGKQVSTVPEAVAARFGASGGA